MAEVTVEDFGWRRAGGEVRAVVSKRGVDDGNQKGGGFLQPAQESHSYYNMEKAKVKKFLKYFEKYFLRLNFLQRFRKMNSALTVRRTNGRKKDRHQSG
jgi:hypothetical protein